MNEAQKIYVQGAQMAYGDCAKFVRHLAANLPEHTKYIEPVFKELSEAFDRKSAEVEKECERFTGNRN